MQLKKILFAVAILGISLPGAAYAADSCPDAETLKQCVDMNVETCRDAASCATDREQALTASDVTDTISTKCCARAEARQRRCIRRQNRKLGRSLRGLPSYIRPFIRQVRSDIADIDCSTNTTTSF